MNIFSAWSQRFLNTFADYTMLREVGQRIASVEEIITSNEHDRQVIREISNNPASEINLLTQLYEQFTKYRNDINKYEPLKANYFVIAMIDTLSYDILAVDPRTNKTFDIEVDNRNPKSNDVSHTI